jgi:hypothetical protein
MRTVILDGKRYFYPRPGSCVQKFIAIGILPIYHYQIRGKYKKWTLLITATKGFNRWTVILMLNYHLILFYAVRVSEHTSLPLGKVWGGNIICHTNLLKDVRFCFFLSFVCIITQYFGQLQKKVEKVKKTRGGETDWHNSEYA